MVDVYTDRKSNEWDRHKRTLSEAADLVEAGDDEAGMLAFDKAIQSMPVVVLSDAYYERACVLASRKQYANAIADFDKAIQIRPEKGFSQQFLFDKQVALSNVFYDRGLAWEKMNEFSKAIADFEETIRLDPSFDTAFLGRGRIKARTGDYELALADFNKVNQVYQYRSDHCVDRAWFFSTCPNEMYRNGAVALKDMINVCNSLGYTGVHRLETLAAAFAEVGDFEKAVKWQTEAVKLATQDDQVDAQSRLVLYETGEPYRDLPKIKEPGAVQETEVGG
jgi:tetratricopeptide (TPR) repeat protein